MLRRRAARGKLVERRTGLRRGAGRLGFADDPWRRKHLGADLMIDLLLVFLGGGLGSVLRYGVGAASVRLLGPAFPWGTLGVNALGGLAIGLLAARIARGQGPFGLAPGDARLLLTTGVLGGFTTFSAFSLETVALWERGAPGLAAAYVLVSVALALGGAAAGLALGRSLG